MANEITAFRTNYFRVINPEAFRKLIGSLYTETGNFVNLWTKSSDTDDLYAFGADAAIIGRQNKSNKDSVECELDDIHKEIQALLHPEHACIITETARTKLQYVTACATIITKQDIRYIDINKEAANLTKKMLNNPDYVIDAYY